MVALVTPSGMFGSGPGLTGGTNTISDNLV